MQYNTYQMVEGQFLSKCIIENDYSAIDKYGITNEYFSEQLWDENDKPTGIKNSSIFDFIKDYYKKYSTMPSFQTVQAEFQDFILYEITDSWKYLVDQLQEHKCIRDCNELLNNASKYNSSQQFIESIKNGIEIVANKNKKYTEEFDIAHEGLNDIWRQYKKDRENPDKMFITTGFKELDDKISGWSRDGEVVVIQGFTGSSKTFVLMKMLHEAWKKGFNVCLFEPECKVKEIAYRWMSLTAHFSKNNLNFGKNIDPSIGLFVQDQLKQNTPHFYILTREMLSTREDNTVSVSQLKNYCINNNIDLLGVDCLDTDYIYDSRSNDNTLNHIKLGHIVDDFDTFSKNCNIPIITTVQRQRGSSDDDIDNHTISGSYKISEKASITLALRKIKGDGLSDIILTMTKNRNGDDHLVLHYTADLDVGQWVFVDNNDPSQKQKDKTRKDL